MTNFVDLLLPAFFVFVITVGLVNIVRYLHSHSTIMSGKAKSLTLEQKLDILADCGFRLSKPFTPENLLESWGRDAFEQPGFELVLVSLGIMEEYEPWRNHCDNLWHFDSECIEDHGDYKRIAERMVEMTQGDLVLENIKDYVNIEESTAWLSYIYQGKPIKLLLSVNDDWVDWHVFSTFAKLLETTASNSLYVLYNLDGQDCLIGYVSYTQLIKLNKYGLNFVPLK
jgi:hypothetical protein